jgi:hypothetical protein
MSKFLLPSADDSFEINQDAVKQMAKVTEGVFLRLI